MGREACPRLEARTGSLGEHERLAWSCRQTTVDPECRPGPRQEAWACGSSMAAGLATSLRAVGAVASSELGPRVSVAHLPGS